MNVSYRGKFYIYVGVTVCCIGGLVFLAWFLFNMITAADASILDAKQEVLSLAAKQGQMGAITKGYDTVHDLLPALDDMLLPHDDKLQFIMRVEDLAARAGVYHVIEAADDAQSAKKDSVAHATTPFNIEIYGSFPNVLRFVYLLESEKTYLSVDRMQIMRMDGGSIPSQSKNETITLGKDDVKAQLSVSVYTR